MILYDTEALETSGFKSDLASFDGNRNNDKGAEIFQSFDKAKAVTLKRLNSELKDLQDRISVVEKITKENCPTQENPFE